MGRVVFLPLLIEGTTTRSICGRVMMGTKHKSNHGPAATIWTQLTDQYPL